MKLCISRPFFLWLLVGLVFMVPLWNAWAYFPLGDCFPTAYSAIGGIIPHSDANGYYEGAYNFLEVGHLNGWNMRRPINALFYAFRLGITGLNFYAALIIQTILAGICCGLASLAVLRTHGKIAAIVVFFGLFFAVSPYLAITLSESLGFVWGALAFAILWQGAALNNLRLFSFGALIFSIALNTRAGPFFILPCLILWGGYHFRSSERLNLKAMAIVTFSIIFGFVFNSILLKIYGDPLGSGVAHANFSETLYGLAAGGKSWNYVYIVHNVPGAQSDRAQFIYQEAFKLIVSNPFNLVLGLLKGLWLFIEGLGRSFSLGLVSNRTLKGLFSVIGFCGLFIGLNRLRKIGQNDKKIGLLWAVFAGALLSIPVIWQDGQVRVFVTIFPFIAAAAGIVFSGFFKESKAGCFDEDAISQRICRCPSVILSLILMAIILIGPSCLRNSYSQIAANDYKNNYGCAEGETALIVRSLSGSPYFHLSSDRVDEASALLAPNIKISRFLEVFKKSSNELVNEWTLLANDINKNDRIVTVASVLNFLNKGQSMIVYSKKEFQVALEESKGKTLCFCAVNNPLSPVLPQVVKSHHLLESSRVPRI